MYKQPDSIENSNRLLPHYLQSVTVPPYLFELLHLYSPSRSLRSASDTWIFRVPRMGRRTLGERSFQYIGPVIWNSLPLSVSSVRHSSSLSSFKSKLKTHLFSSAYWSVVFFPLYQPMTGNTCICSVCVCVCVCVWWNEHNYTYVFVRAPGSYEMGRHK